MCGSRSSNIEGVTLGRLLRHRPRHREIFQMNSRLAAAAVAAAALASAAGAQTAKPATATAPKTITRAELTANIDAEFRGLDTNGDGKISTAEAQAAVGKRASEAEVELRKRQEADFRKLDTDKNGQLSLAEYEAAMSIKPNAGAATERLKMFDSNKDGVISAAEFRAPVLARFDAADANKDGIVSEAEAKAAAAKQAR